MAGRGQVSWLPGWVGRTFPGICVFPSGRRRQARPRSPRPGHSGGTTPVSHRTSLDHRPYLRAESIRLRPLGHRRSIGAPSSMEVSIGALTLAPPLAGPGDRLPRPLRRPRRHVWRRPKDRRPHDQGELAARQPADPRLAARQPAAGRGRSRQTGWRRSSITGPPGRHHDPRPGPERRPRRFRRHRPPRRHRTAADHATDARGSTAQRRMRSRSTRQFAGACWQLAHSDAALVAPTPRPPPARPRAANCQRRSRFRPSHSNPGSHWRRR